MLHALTCFTGVTLALFFDHALLFAVSGLASFLLLVSITKPHWTPTAIFGAANWITTVRLLLTTIVLFLPGSFTAGVTAVFLSILVLVLDGFDGRIARERGLASEFGEHYDKESDAFFMLALCLAIFMQGRLDAWILIPGLLRYGFVLTLFLLKPDLGKEYRSNWARWIYVFSISGLLSVFVLPPFIHLPAVVLTTTALLLSFAHYFRWILVQRFRFSSPRAGIYLGIASFLILNTLLLLPSFITNLQTSSFFPIPDPSKPISTLTWTRGWYDYFLYFFIRRPNQDLFRLCADLVFLLTAFMLLRKKPRISIWLAAIFFALLVYAVYDAIVFDFFHRHGLFYEDVQYGINLYYLLIDSLSAEHAFRLIAGATGIVLLAWSLPALFRHADAALSSIHHRWIHLGFHSMFWPYLVVIWFWFGPVDERPTVRLITGKITSNLIQSNQLSATLANLSAQPVDSVYFSFEDQRLDKRPNLVFFMVESYGRVLFDTPHLRAGYDSLLTELEHQLDDAGYTFATRTSVAPVSGGLSWLSMNSLFSGLQITNRTIYSRYEARVDEYPHLVRFLKQAGYHTITLQPPNRARAGLPLENPYRFDTTIFFDDLNYTGPARGIWIIPDQYSLEYAQENYLQSLSPPFMLFFETATTHAPWTDLPPYVSDWRTLNDQLQEPPPEEHSLADQLQNSFRNRFHVKTEYADALYWKSIVYDLKILRDYMLKHAPDNTLIVWLGDHQPPLLPSSSYETPVHVLSKQADLIDRFSAFDFETGLHIPESRTDTLTHAGIYSLLMDVLTTQADSLPSPSFRPHGIAPSILMDLQVPNSNNDP